MEKRGVFSLSQRRKDAENREEMRKNLGSKLSTITAFEATIFTARAHEQIV
jgi:hypothetical protein